MGKLSTRTALKGIQRKRGNKDRFLSFEYKDADGVGSKRRKWEATDTIVELV